MDNKIFGQARDRCAYNGCSNGIARNGMKLFRFPSNPIRLKKWLDACGNDKLHRLAISTLVRYGVCSDHFADDVFLDASKRRIKRYSIPLQYHPYVEENENEMEMISLGTDETDNEDNFIPQKRTHYDDDVNKSDTQCEKIKLKHSQDNAKAKMNDSSASGVAAVIINNTESQNKKINEMNLIIKELTQQNKILGEQLAIMKRNCDRNHVLKKKIKPDCDMFETLNRMSPNASFEEQKKTVMQIINSMNISSSAKTMISLQLHLFFEMNKEEEYMLAIK